MPAHPITSVAAPAAPAGGRRALRPARKPPCLRVAAVPGYQLYQVARRCPPPQVAFSEFVKQVQKNEVQRVVIDSASNSFTFSLRPSSPLYKMLPGGWEGGRMGGVGWGEEWGVGGRGPGLVCAGADRLLQAPGRGPATRCRAASPWLDRGLPWAAW